VFNRGEASQPNTRCLPICVLPISDGALKAAGEETRLRVLALLAEAELHVLELTDILRQSQPRISRHSQLLAEAGLVEAASARVSGRSFRLGERGPAAELARALVGRLDPLDTVIARDRERLASVRAARAAARRPISAATPPEWDRIRQAACRR